MVLHRRQPSRHIQRAWPLRHLCWRRLYPNILLPRHQHCEYSLFCFQVGCTANYPLIPFSVRPRPINNGCSLQSARPRQVLRSRASTSTRTTILTCASSRMDLMYTPKLMALLCTCKYSLDFGRIPTDRCRLRSFCTEARALMVLDFSLCNCGMFPPKERSGPSR